MKKIVITLVLIGIISALAYFLVLPTFSKEKENQQTNQGTNTGDEDETPEYNSKSISEITTSAWIPYWDYSNGLETLQANPGKFDSISPVVYELNSDGSLKKTKGDNFKELQEYAAENEIEFIPSIAMFDHELFTEVLQDQENFNRHIDAILTEIEENEFDGIDIDYESTKKDDEEQYRKFIQAISEGCEELNAKLTITVLPKWAPDIVYPSLNETRSVQDWEFLADYADEIRIMAYDYTSQYSQEPGPIAPLSWIELILEKALREIPEDKIILGVHNYGYNWSAENISENVNFENNPPTEKLRADAYTYDQIQDIMNTYKGQINESLLWGEKYYTYERERNPRVLIYVDPENLEQRKELAAEYGIKGISIWRLGDDSRFNY